MHEWPLLVRGIARGILRHRVVTMRIILDFDGTITQRDTIGELARSAIDSKLRCGQPSHAAAWKDAVHAYQQDLGAYKASHWRPKPQMSLLDQETRFLAELKPVEEASLTRVSLSGLFAGLSNADLYGMGVDAVSTGRVSIRRGFFDLLDMAQQRGVHVHIVSVNWSSAFIAGVVGVRGVNIVANDIDRDGHICGPQHLSTRLTTAPDKVNAVRHILGGEGDDVYYFGDSATDLGCLLLRSGVVLADDPEDSSLLQTLSRIGVDVAHVSSLQERGDQKLWWARDFCEVLHSRLLQP